MPILAVFAKAAAAALLRAGDIEAVHMNLQHAVRAVGALVCRCTPDAPPRRRLLQQPLDVARRAADHLLRLRVEALRGGMADGHIAPTAVEEVVTAPLAHTSR